MVRRATRPGRLRVGTSGFHYSHWRRVFFPPELPAADWLAFYAGRFDTVEINVRYVGSYSLQKLTAEAKRIRRWLAEGLDVYAYFNNDAGGCAVRNATDLRRYCTDGDVG